MKFYRLTKTVYAATAFEGIGSQRAGGRWNTPGRAVIYASEHPATATLEILVHVKRAQLLRDHYSLITAEVPNAFVRSLDLDALPEGWDAQEETAASTGIGDAWFDQRVSVALRVPSVVLREQFNVLLNPMHPDWQRFTLHEDAHFYMWAVCT